MACKVICQEPNKTMDDDLLFQIIIGAKNQTEEVKKMRVNFQSLLPKRSILKVSQFRKQILKFSFEP